MFVEINGVYYNRNTIKAVYKSVGSIREFYICKEQL